MIAPLPIAVAALAQRARLLLRSSSQATQEVGRRVLHLLRDSSAQRAPMSTWSAADAWWETARGASLVLEGEDGLRGATSSISCSGPGCSGCCRDRVEATMGEAEVMASRLDGTGWARVEAWREGDPCPILTDDGLCSHYASRPTACRVRCVVTPREWCDPALGRQVAILSDPIRDALLEGIDEGSTLPELLQAIRAREAMPNTSARPA